MACRIDRSKSPEPLSILQIGGHEYKAILRVGRGASSVAYETVRDDGCSYVVKEFYPDQGAKMDPNGKIAPCEGWEVAFSEWKQRFEDAKKAHADMGKQDRNFFLECENIPDSEGFVVMHARDGVTLDKWRHGQVLSLDNLAGVEQHIKTCVNYIRYLADELNRIYHSRGRLHLDIKPENVFVFADEEVLLRLIDFDSMQKTEALFDDIKKQKAYIYTTESFYGQEIHQDNINNISVEKPDDLKAIDYYALGNLFYFMLYGCDHDNNANAPDKAVEAYLEQYPALEEYLNDLFGAHFFVDLNKRIRDFTELDQDFEHIELLLSSGLLRSFNEAYQAAHFVTDMMPSLFYQNRDYPNKNSNHPLYQLLQKIPGNIQIIGQGGSGKSTLLRYFTYRSAILFSSWKVKLLCHYEDLHELISDRSVSDLIKRVQASEAPTGVTVVWLLDAFDEIGKAERAKSFLDKLRQINNPAVRIIISSRNRIEHLDYSVVQMAPLTEEQRNKLFRRVKLNQLPFDFDKSDFLSTPLAVNLMRGMYQSYNGNEFQSFQEHLIGKQQLDGVLHITSLGELVWNYLHTITLSSALDDDSKIDAGVDLLHNVLIQAPNINFRAKELEYGSYNEYSGKKYIDVDKETLKKLKRFEKLGFYSIKDILWNDLQGHKIEFSHKIFSDFFCALQRYHQYEKLYEDIKTADDVKAEQIFAESPVLSSSNWYGADEGDSIEADPGNPSSLCRDILNSTSKKAEILLPILDLFRNQFGVHPFGYRESIDEQEQIPWYSFIVTELMQYLCTYEANTIVFRDLDLSNLFLGELAVYDNFRFLRSQHELLTVFDYDSGLYKYESPSKKEVLFENVIFDGTLLWLKSYCWYQFKNCSFKNLNGNSFIHPSLNISGVHACYVTGQDLYTINRSALMDCVETGDTAQEIVIYPNTEYVDWEFAKHYTKRTRPIHICNENKKFWLDESKDALFHSWNTLCFANDSTEYRSICYDNLDIRFAAFWHCSKLKTLRFFAGKAEKIGPDIRRTDNAPLSRCTNLRMLEFDGVPIIVQTLYENCPQIKVIHLLSNIPLREYPSIGSLLPNGEFKIDLSFPDDDGCAVPFGRIPDPFNCHPSIFVPHDLVQAYLDNVWWDEYFIYDEKRLPEIDRLPYIGSDKSNLSDLFDWICEEDGFEDSAYPRG